MWTFKVLLKNYLSFSENNRINTYNFLFEQLYLQFYLKNNDKHMKGEKYQKELNNKDFIDLFLKTKWWYKVIIRYHGTLKYKQVLLRIHLGMFKLDVLQQVPTLNLL